MLPKRSKYAIKALTCLAKAYFDKKPLSITHICESEKIPRKFLEQIILELRQQGFVKSKMGPTGGYMLAKHPEEIMMSQIIRASGGAVAILPCVSLNFYEKCQDCESEETCPLHDIAFELREASLKILSKSSLTDLILREKRLIRKINN
jgi:Rrf2 family protein